jgi:hypothetical protein
MLCYAMLCLRYEQLDRSGDGWIMHAYGEHILSSISSSSSSSSSSGSSGSSGSGGVGNGSGGLGPMLLSHTGTFRIASHRKTK